MIHRVNTRLRFVLFFSSPDRIDDQLSEIKADLEKHELSRQTLLDCVQRDRVVPREVTVKETAQEPQGLEAAGGGQISPIPVISRY